jgi:UDPglucose--hexose-1-phosphate uridylyltransferase
MAWEQRWHPLRREWVVISSHRNNRPWLGETVGDARSAAEPYVPDCYLCPGNARVSGRRNPAYEGVYAFDNDHPCVAPSAPEPEPSPHELFRVARAEGLSRVVCYTPRHDLSFAELSHAEVVSLLEALGEQYRELGAMANVNHVLMFENRGEVVGVSNPHPHCQVYATSFVFRTIEVEAAAAAEHHASRGTALLADIIAAEEADGRRVVTTGEESLAFVPFFARYPYETYIAPRATRASVADLTPTERDDFAATLRETLARMDNLWRMAFPYVLVLHQAPTDGLPHPGFHFHVQVHPPLRKPGLLKYLAGPEIGGGNFLNDTAPEEKAAELRAVSGAHYRSAAAHA